MTRVLVRSESILTQLLFDHSLRLRMKDAIPDEPKRTDIDIPSIVIGEETANLAERNMVGTEEPPAPQEAVPKEQGNAQQGIAGKINVLMASDVAAVGNGRDVALIFVYCPTQLIACGVFLYRILSWSRSIHVEELTIGALIGIVVMIITLPIPSLLTKISADLQAEKMTATDARVDVITEAVGALKMLKMFAWEDRIKERISAKREVELHVIWKRRIVSL
jgi:ABC-type multidrug transport system fused ATPase/permease subunit